VIEDSVVLASVRATLAGPEDPVGRQPDAARCRSTSSSFPVTRTMHIVLTSATKSCVGNDDSSIANARNQHRKLALEIDTAAVARQADLQVLVVHRLDHFQVDVIFAFQKRES
jgi:hypothetical protein